MELLHSLQYLYLADFTTFAATGGSFGHTVKKVGQCRLVASIGGQIASVKIYFNLAIAF